MRLRRGRLARVGISVSAAYKLRRRPDAVHFRRAWEAAIAHAIRRLSEAAMSRALNGVSRPIFYKGEQIGERRYYDERLTQFLLRHNDPVHYGRWRDQAMFEQPEGATARVLAREINALGIEAWHRAYDVPLPPPLPRKLEEDEDEALQRQLDEEYEEAKRAGRAELLAEQAAAAVAEAVRDATSCTGS